MRAVVQRVSRAGVTVAGEVTGEIALGLLVLLGVGKQDIPKPPLIISLTRSSACAFSKMTAAR